MTLCTAFSPSCRVTEITSAAAIVTSSLRCPRLTLMSIYSIDFDVHLSLCTICSFLKFPFLCVSQSVEISKFGCIPKLGKRPSWSRRWSTPRGQRDSPGGRMSAHEARSGARFLGLIPPHPLASCAISVPVTYGRSRDTDDGHTGTQRCAKD